MNALQAMIERRTKELREQTHCYTNDLKNVHTARMLLAGGRANLEKEKNIIIACGAAGKNAEERTANLALSLMELTKGVASLEQHFEACKLGLEITQLYHQEARYALRAAIAISEARDK